MLFYIFISRGGRPEEGGKDGKGEDGFREKKKMGHSWIRRGIRLRLEGTERETRFGDKKEIGRDKDANSVKEEKRGQKILYSCEEWE